MQRSEADTTRACGLIYNHSRGKITAFSVILLRWPNISRPSHRNVICVSTNAFQPTDRASQRPIGKIAFRHASLRAAGASGQN